MEGITIIDKVWLNQQAKRNAIASEARRHPGIAIICWFEDSFAEWEKFFDTNGLQAELFAARQASWHHVEHSKVIFTEHYPLVTKEEEIFQKLQLDQAIIYSSLDDPFLLQFGGAEIKTLAEQMGTNEDQPLEHPMITRAIRNAQEKISSQVQVEMTACSQADWLMKNLLA